MANSTSAGFKAGPAQSGAMEGLLSFLQTCNQYTGISTESVMNWGVYVLKPDQLFKHHSLLFCCKGAEFNFIVELLKDEAKKGNYYASIRAHIIDLSKYPQLTREELGDVQMKIQDIISQAWATLTTMGCYSAIVNNCQVCNTSSAMIIIPTINLVLHEANYQNKL